MRVRRWMWLTFCGILAVSVFAGVLWHAQFGQRSAPPDSETVRTALLESEIVEQWLNESLLERAGFLGELRDPAMTLPHTHMYPPGTLRILLHAEASCQTSALPQVENPGLLKLRAWVLNACAGTPLPADFWDTPPYMHPMGKSFALLAQERKIVAPANRRHVLEPADPSLESDAAAQVTLLRHFSSDTLWYLKVRKPVILDEQSGTMLLRDTVSMPEPRYAVVRSARLGPYLARRGIVLEALRDGVSCTNREGDFCWNFIHPPEPLLPPGVLTGLLVFLSLSTGAGLVVAFVNVRSAQRDRLFALQTLTHELRTPATSLRLAIESLRDDFDQMGETGKQAFLTLAGEVRRLNRVVQGSAEYLRVSSKPDERDEQVPSLREFLTRILHEFEGRLALELPAEDAGLRVSPYWLALCVRNLIRNAFEHGRPPVMVRLELRDDEVSIHVIDAGDAPAGALKELTRAFVRGRRSRGLGLGLSLVAQVMRRLGGRLALGTAPTTFTLRFRKDRLLRKEGAPHDCDHSHSAG